MHKTRTPLRKWFWAMYLAVTDKRGYSALGLMRRISVSYQTAWTMLHKIRHAMKLRDAHYVLNGFIRLDEGFFGGPDGKQGRGTEKTPAFVAVSVDNKGRPLFVKIGITTNVNQSAVDEFVYQFVTPGSYITTDGLNVYNKLFEQGYLHESYLAADSKCKAALKWLHTIVSNAKAFIAGTYHGLSKRHLQAYLDEFCYRFNRRFKGNQMFPRLVTACSSATTVTYRQVVSEAA